MNKVGNPGYGKMELVRSNVDKFSPQFWLLMDEYSKSKDRNLQKIFIAEFNKLQAKMIPQIIGGDSENPIPIINIPYVPGNDGDQEDKVAQEAD